MDSEVFDAVTIVDIGPGQEEEWFTLVANAHAAANDDWTAFRENLTAAAASGFAPAAETFLRHAADHGELALITRVVADLNALPSTYADARAQPAAPPADSLWSAAVEQFVAGWAGWDGLEEGWAEFRDWFYAAANSYDSGMYAVVFERLDPLNGVSLPERVAALTGFGFTITATADAAAQASSNPFDAILDESLESAMNAVPGAEALSEEQLARIRAEVAEELARKAGE